MLKTAAVLPINTLASAKSRLAAQMTDADRQELILWMAHHVIGAVQTSGVVEHVVIVSPDRAVLRWASGENVQPIYQADSGLNPGLELGRRWAQEIGAEALLVLLADLPCLAADEISHMVTAGQQAGPQTVVLAPDHAEQGTNGLFLRLSARLPFAFGVDSLARHRMLATRKRLKAQLFSAPGLRFDVDTPADLAMLYEYGIWTPEGDDEQLVSIGASSRDGVA